MSERKYFQMCAKRQESDWRRGDGGVGASVGVYQLDFQAEKQKHKGKKKEKNA